MIQGNFSVLLMLYAIEYSARVLNPQVFTRLLVKSAQLVKSPYFASTRFWCEDPSASTCVSTAVSKTPLIHMMCPSGVIRTQCLPYISTLKLLPAPARDDNSEIPPYLS